MRVLYARPVEKLTNSMSDNHSEPLLGGEPTQEEVPEDLERGLSGAPGHDFRHLIEAQPEAVIRYLLAGCLPAQTTMFVRHVCALGHICLHPQIFGKAWCQSAWIVSCSGMASAFAPDPE